MNIKRTLNQEIAGYKFLRQSMFVLIGGFSVILLVMGGSVWTSIEHLDQTHKVLSTIVERNMKQTVLFSQMRRVSQQRTNLLLATVKITDLLEHKELQSQFSALESEFNDYHTKSKSLSLAGSRSILRAQGGIIESVITLQSGIHKSLLERNDDTDIGTLIANAGEAQRLMSRAMAKLAEVELDTSRQSQKAVQKGYQRAKQRIVMSSAIAALAALFTIILVVRFIQHGETTLRAQATELRKHYLK